MNTHTAPIEVRCPEFSWDPRCTGDTNSETFVENSRMFGRSLPTNVRFAIAEFRAHSHASGALLIRNLPFGSIPATPGDPRAHTFKDSVSERTLLGVGTLLGEPIGYAPEMSGDIIQNLVPTRANSDRQVSTSSAVPLLFHTETAFHPHRPTHLLLLCLRADSTAETTLSSIAEVVNDLSAATVDVLFQRRFRTGVDESFLNGRANVLGPRVAVLAGDRASPILTFDEDLMIGIDPEAADALSALGRAVARRHSRLTLKPGDLLVIDNQKAVHGRGPYKPRFDGTDRWLQRSFVIQALPSRSEDRSGRVIRTEFGVELRTGQNLKEFHCGAPHFLLNTFL